jgi:DNA primase
MKIRYSEFVNRIDVDAFKEAIEFEPVDTNGENDIGHCPDVWGLHKHGDTTGKFAIHRGKRLYNCWVCGGGSLLSLVMEMYDYDVDEATEWLYQFARGDTRSDSEFIDDFLAMIQDDKHREETLPYFNPRVLEKFKDDPSWFLTRGITEEVIEEYGLRYAEVGMKTAPIRQRKDGPEKIDDDYYGPTAVFPHFWEGKLVGWQNRWINDPDTPKWLAKYTNTTDFPKSYTLFNLDKAQLASEPVVVCESVPTVLMLASIDVAAISYFGGTIKEPQLRLLRRLNQGVILAPDNDGPGEKFLEEATGYLERYIPVYHLPTVDLHEGSDLGDLYTPDNPRLGEAMVKEHLKKAYLPSLT